MAMKTRNHQWLLKKRPTASEIIGPEHFDYVAGAMPLMGENEFLVRTLVLGTSPAQRAYVIEKRRFHAGVEIGEVMHGRGIGVVEASNNPNFKIGDWVAGSLGWQEYSVQRTGLGPRGTVDVASVQHVNSDIRPSSLHLGALGNAGYTALYGLEDIGEISPGKTVVISSAAGGVGAMAGQISKRYKCRTIGIAGGPEKGAWICDHAKYDAAIDYKNEDVGAALDRLCPDGIDIYFDNVGGTMLDTVLQRLAIGARIVLCGAISTEYLEHRPPGPAWYTELIYKRARMEGLVVWDQVKRYPEFQTKLKGWYDAGEIQAVDDISEGLETMPDALKSLFIGGNTGIKLVRVSDDPR